MTAPIYDINRRYRAVSQPHESSLARLIKQIVVILTILGLVYACFDLYRHEVQKPLPPLITPQQRQHAKEIEKRFSLAGWCWSVETTGQTVELYDPKVKAWRRL